MLTRPKGIKLSWRFKYFSWEVSLKYQGPIYRPPSEADSLLVQATLGCPHNKCSFCMVYKKGPRFKVRPVAEVEAELAEAAQSLSGRVETIFFPAGNTMAMPTEDLAGLCETAGRLFQGLKRITVYASFPAVEKHGPEGLARLRQAGLKRLHVGLESGHGPTLSRHKKGVDPMGQVRAGRMALEAGFELNLYVMAGLAGRGMGTENALATAGVLNQINRAGHFDIRLRTLVPKVDTLLLYQIKRNRFTMASCKEVLRELKDLVENLDGPAGLYSDHYTNYLNLEGALPADKPRLISELEHALTLPRNAFRPDFIGEQ